MTSLCYLQLSLLLSHSVMSDSVRPHGLQHTRLPCPSLSPGVCSNSCPLSQWCHPTYFIFSRPLLLLSSNFPGIRVFYNEWALCIRWPKYWNFSFIVSPSNEYSGMISSVQFSCLVMSDSLWTHGPQHARLPYPSPTPRVYPNSCPLNWWCHPTISSSVVPFSSRLQSFPVSESFQMSQLFESGGQNIGVSASAPVLPMNTQDWSPLGWTGWISLESRGLSRVFSNTMVQKHQFFRTQLSL